MCDPSSSTRDQTQIPCIGRMESQPLDHQGIPGMELYTHSSALGGQALMHSLLVLDLWEVG